LSFTADIATYGGMLDLKLSLYNSSGGLVTSADSSSLGESISATVSAGTYYLVVASHGSYGDVGQYSLSGTVPTGGAAPVANAGGPYTVAEGGSVQLSGSDSTGTSLNYAWDLDGDGNYGETGAGATRGNETGATPTFSAAGLDGPGTYNVSLRVTDGSSQTSTASVTINLANVAPTLGISGANSVSEGSVYTLSLSSTDPGGDSITSWFITWGDGTTQTINGDPSSVTKTYADNGVYTITATATDEDGTFSAGSKQITVSNVAPTITAGGNATANEGSLYTLSLSAADPGDDEITGFTIDWGDGVSEDVSVHSNGHYSHTFADSGSYTVRVSADDEDGTYTNTAEKSVAVANVAPTVSISGNSSALTAAEYSLLLDSSDPGDDTISSWLINWGDGNSQTVEGNLTSVTHAYASGGSYTISASATDDDGSYSAGDKQITISDSDTTPPQAQLTQADGLYTTGTGSYQLRITYSDASGMDSDSINSSDILVSGPNGFSQIASLDGIADGENGEKIATYSISPPGGAWDPADSGQYQIALRAGQVSDAGGNTAPAATLGAFMVGVLPPDTAGLNMATARNVGTVSSTKLKIVEDGVGIPDRNDYVKFTVGTKSSITIKLYNLVDNADLYIYNASGTRVAYSKKAITSIENIVKTLSAGTYYARVMFAGVVGTPYRLRISSAAVSATPVTPAGLAGAINLGSLERGATKALSADIAGGSVVYQFTSTGAAHLYTKLYQNTDNLQLELLDSTGQRIGFSDGAGTANEVIRATIHAATYYVRITFAGATATPFRLRLALG
jgi:PKD repeat protein